MLEQPILPVQQAAVQQQFQQNQVPMPSPAIQLPNPKAEFNAIKINILGANVDAPSQNKDFIPVFPQDVQQIPKINYIA